MPRGAQKKVDSKQSSRFLHDLRNELCNPKEPHHGLAPAKGREIAEVADFKNWNPDFGLAIK